MIWLLFSFIGRNWKLFALIAGLIALYSWHKWQVHEGYVEGKKEVLVQLLQEQRAHHTDIENWTAQVEAVTEENKKIQQEKDQLTENLNRRNKLIQDLNKKQQEKTKHAIKEQIKPTDVVTAPANYFWLYNDAVRTFGSTESKAAGTDEAPRPDPETPARSIDATAFAEVTIGNVNKYNALARQTDLLIDAVEECYGINRGGTGGQVEDVGRDISTGTTGPNQ